MAEKAAKWPRHLRAETFWLLPLALLLLYALMLSQRASNADTRTAHAGYLDARSWNTRDLLVLGGEWHLTQADFSGSAPVSQSWESRRRQVLPSLEPGTYTLRLDLPPQAVGRILKVHAPETLPFFEIYVNDQRVARSGPSVTGKPVASRLQSQIPFVLQQSSVTLKVVLTPVGALSNGLRGPLQLGPAEVIEQAIHTQRLHFALVIGGICMLLVYYLVFYFQRRELSILLFCSICLGAISYIDSLFAHLFETFFGAVPLGVSMRWLRLTMYLNLPLFLYYVHILFGVPFVRGSARVMKSASLILILTLCLPMRWMSAAYYLYYACFLLMFPCMAWMIFQAHRQKHEDLRLYVLSYVLLMATYVFDSLHYLRLIQGDALVPWGLLLFCLAQSTILAQRFNHDYHLSRRLGKELQQTNRSLEQTVQQRTQHLAIQNQEVAKLSAFKDRVTRMLLHDLKTPLGLLRHQGSEANTLTQIAADEIERMLDQLQATEELAVPQLPVRLESLYLRDVLERALRLYQPWISEQKIHVMNEVAASLRVQADAELLVRVVHNLLSNALKSMEQHGSIQLQAHQGPEWVQLDLYDTGRGFAQHQQDEPLRMGITQFKSEYAQSQGIGLAYCQLAMETQGGRLFWENHGSGARVSLYLQPVPKEPPLLPLRLQASEAEQARHLVTELETLAFYELSALLRVIDRYTSGAGDDWLLFLKTLRHSIERADEASYQELKERMQHAYFDR
ncbi:MAG: 7TM diverse intracellular signaling domain-containing protein [Candidatus Sericytochromatia bacterium]